MARPGSTYRGARFKAGNTKPLTIASGAMFQRTGQKLQLMPEPKYRPVAAKGWDWRKGGRAARDAARSPGFAAVISELVGA